MMTRIQKQRQKLIDNIIDYARGEKSLEKGIELYAAHNQMDVGDLKEIMDYTD